MLKLFFPKGYQRYLSLPVLGPALDGFTKFLTRSGYPRPVVRAHLRATFVIDGRLQQHQCHSIEKITRDILQACAPPPGHSQEDIGASAATKLLQRYFDELGIFPPPNPLNLTEKKLIEYRNYLQQVRGFSTSTVHHHCYTVLEFLGCLDKLGGLAYLSKLTSQDIEDFILQKGRKLKRGSLQHLIAHLRAFLRFLVVNGEISTEFNKQIDTPRIYRDEQLPRSLDWEIVHKLLKSIDRSTALGKRDYAVFLLITTYGLRTSEIVALKLEDIEWRKNRLKIFQRKTNSPLLLPLMDAVGNSILDYLRHGRPSVKYREIFVRHRAPSGILKPTAVTEIFQAWSQRSGLEIPFQGPHCLRHSYAVHLLRQGTSLKAIGDILGHRNFESTQTYLRLNLDDLQTIPLNLPMTSTPHTGA